MLPRFFIGIMFISFSVFAACNSEQERKIPDAPAVEQPVNDFALLEEELSKDTSNIEMRTMLATRYYSSGDLIKAAYHFLKIYNQDPKNYAALTNLGNIYYDSQQDIKAIEFYEKALAIDPADINIRCDLATCYSNVNKMKKAKQILEENIRIDARHSKSHHNLSVILRKNGDIERADKELAIYKSLSGNAQ